MDENSIAEKTSFTANGKEYFLTSKLSIARFVEFEKLGIIHGFGKDFQAVFSDLADIYECLENQKIASAAVKVSNLLQGVTRVLQESDHHPILKICALFINTKDENVKEYNEAVIESKIQDWYAEGFNFDDFFLLASSLVKGYMSAYEKITADFSKLEATLRKKQQKNS